MEELLEPECELGYTVGQVKDIVDDYEPFCDWIRGQTMGICNGERWNYDTDEYEEACGGISHGPVIYEHDVRRYVNG